MGANMNERRSNNRHMVDVMRKRDHATRNARCLDKWQETGGENLLSCFFWLCSFERLGCPETSSLEDLESPEIELSL